jgi:hypothetical protein
MGARATQLAERADGTARSRALRRFDRLSDSRRELPTGGRYPGAPPAPKLAAMSPSPNIRRYALVPDIHLGPGARRWRLARYAEEAAAALTSAANASTSAAVVSHEHIQRTSPVDSSHT